MKILFLNPPFGSRRPEGLDAPMGIMYLGAVLDLRGHECALVDNVWEKENDWTRWLNALNDKPGAVCVTTHIRFSNDTREAMRLLRQRHPSLPVFAFGPQASTEAPRLLDDMGFDACVIGEPEEVVPAVLEELRAGSGRPEPTSRPGLATKGNPAPGSSPRINVELLPFPDWELGDYGRYIATTNNAVVMASRGYNMGDAFNQPPLIHAEQPAVRASAQRTMAELLALRTKFPGHYTVLFHDEVFTESREWVTRLCSKLEEARLGFPCWCFTRPELLDEELCRLMRKAGFAGISMGMESASARVLKMLGREITPEQIENGFRASQKAGLLTVGSVMVGTPGCAGNGQDETAEEIAATERMVKSLHPDVLTVTLTTPLPGTPLYDKCKNRILACTPEDFNIYHVWPGKQPVQLDSLTAADLAKAVDRLRAAWKKGLWKTTLRITKLGLTHAAFRATVVAQVIKVIKRKVIGNS